MDVAAPNPPLTDTPQARRYNRIRRWLGISDALIGFALLVVLLVTGWTALLRDWSYHLARQHYFFAVFLYVLMFTIILPAVSSTLQQFGWSLQDSYRPCTQYPTALLLDPPSARLLCLA